MAVGYFRVPGLSRCGRVWANHKNIHHPKTNGLIRENAVREEPLWRLFWKAFLRQEIKI